MKYKKNYKPFTLGLMLILSSAPALKAQYLSESTSPDHAVITDTHSKASTGKEGDDKKLFDLAVQYSIQNQWGKAEKIYRDLIKQYPLWPEVKNNLAVVLLKMEKLDEARELLEKAVTSSPSYRIAQQNRSMLYSFMANRAYNKVLDSNQILQLPELELILEIENVGVIEKQVMGKPPGIFSKETVLQIEQQLKAWSYAWSEGDFERYIQTYSPQFIPSDNQTTFVQWKQGRKSRLVNAQGVSVDIEQIRVFFEYNNEKRGDNGVYVLVEFLQHYQSASYKDTVLKQMYMHKHSERWLIMSERTLKTF